MFQYLLQRNDLSKNAVVQIKTVTQSNSIKRFVDTFSFTKIKKKYILTQYTSTKIYLRQFNDQIKLYYTFFSAFIQITNFRQFFSQP